LKDVYVLIINPSRRKQAKASPKEHRRNLEKGIFATAKQLHYRENDPELKGEVRSFPPQREYFRCSETIKGKSILP
jgi:hypothetical protein